MPSNTPLVDVLSLLDLYSTSHTKASSSLKSTIWNISKARRQKGGLGVGFSISAFDVREELRAHATLECKCSHEPSLADEDSSEKEYSGDSAVADDSFVLNFGCIPKAKESEKSNANAAIKTLDETGLRQRKGKEETSSSTNTWTEETHEDEMEEKLRKQDPIGKLQNIYLQGV